MGIFKAIETAVAEERDAKYKANHPELYADKVKWDKRFEDGISSVAEPEDYSKIIIEQNQAIIDLLAVIAINRDATSGTFANMYNNEYIKKINKIVFKY